MALTNTGRIKVVVSGARGPGLNSENLAVINDATARSEAGAERAETAAESVEGFSDFLTFLNSIFEKSDNFPDYLRIIKDSANRLLWGIRADGVEYAHRSERDNLTVTTRLASEGDADFQRLTLGNSTREAITTFPGWLSAMKDPSRRLIHGVKEDGSVYIHKLAVDELDVPGLQASQTVAAGPEAVVFTKPDNDGNYQVFAQSRDGGAVVPVTTSGDHTGLSANGSIVTWVKDGSEGEYYDMATGQTGPLVARRKLIAIGHSMLADYDSNRQPPLPTRIASILGWEVQNFAIQGQQSAQQVARMGLVPLTVTLDGNQIPASGSANITAITPNDWAARAYGPRSIYGTLAGVYGYITWDSTAGERFFRAEAGAAVNIPAAAPFVPDVGDAFESVVLIWSLVNDGQATQEKRDASMANLALIVNAQKALGRRFVILTELNSGAEPAGSAGYTNLMALNDMIKATYPDNVFDARQALVDAYDPTLAADVTAHNEDRPAPSLRESDDFHPNNAGNAVLAPQIAAFINSKKWNEA